MKSATTTKDGDMEERTRERRITRTRNEVVGCVQDVAGKKKFLVQFEDGHIRDMSASLLSCVFYKEEVVQEANQTISDLPKNKKVIF